MFGKKFGRLQVVAIAEKDKYGHKKWLCKCDCGTEKIILQGSLTIGRTKSCGCLFKEQASQRAFKHGYGTKRGSTYWIWPAMKSRCLNKNNKDYANYGGRGIKVCDEWMDFVNFLFDMGEKPKDLSIDRINNNGNYSKENCKWATNLEQANNHSNNKRFIFNSRNLTIAEWCREFNLKYQIVNQRIFRGWDIKRALNLT